MAYRTVEESSLTGIADAIREAGGTGESLLFPEGFRTAISNMGGSGGTLTITAPAGVLVSVGKDGKSKTKMADGSGIAVFQGLESGTWTVFITNGSETASKTVEIVADYATTITFFAATIHITYPAGSACTATDGSITLTAPDTSGVWDCVVPNAGTWTVSVESIGRSETVVITTDQQEESVDLTIMWLYRDGDELTEISGGWTFQKAISAYGASGTGNKNADNLEIATPSGTTVAGAWRTTNKIDLTKYSTLNVNFSEIDTAKKFSRMCISVKKTLSTTDDTTTNMITAEPLTSLLGTDQYPDFTAPHIAVLDVASLTGEYYMIWGVAKANSVVGVSSTKVTEVYLT